MVIRSLLVTALAAAALTPASAGSETQLPATRPTAGSRTVVDPVVRVPGTTAGGHRPAVAVDDAGRVTAVWRQAYRAADGTHAQAVLAARRNVGGRWSAPRALGCAPTAQCITARPQVGVDAAGVVTAAWLSDTTVIVVRRPLGSPWGKPRIIGTTRDSYGLDLAVARNGEVVVVWDTHPRGEPRKTRAAVRSPGGSWTEATSIGRGFYPQVATASTGTAVAVLSRGSDALWLRATRFLPHRGWGSPVRLCRAGLEGAGVAMGPRGRALVTMDRYDSGGVDVREMSSNGRWGPTRSLSPTDFAWAGAPLVDHSGVQVVAFLDGHRVYDDNAKVVRKPAGGEWRGTTLLRHPTDTSPVQLVVNRRNDLALAFGRHTLLRHHGSSTWSAPVRSHLGVLAVLAHGSALRLWWDDRGLVTQRIHPG